MDKFVIRKEKVLDRHASAARRPKSSFSDARNISSVKSSRVPQAPFLSSRVSRVNRIIDSTLADPSNPVSHNDAYRRAQHVVSASTGHQQSNSCRGASAQAQYNVARLAKLRAQAKPAETNILQQTVVYINGYTGTKVTNQALIGMIHSAGGQVRPIFSAVCTHIVTAMPLSAKKAQKELDRKKGGPRIVKPEWVLDSIRLGKRQPEWKYPIQELPTQARIPAIFGKAPTSDQQHQDNC